MSWIAYKYTPRIPKQERFVEIAKVYHSIHLDLMLRKAKQNQETGRFLGNIGDKVADLTLKVIKVKVEDDPYKTRINGTTVQFYIRQIVTLTDTSGNLVVIRFTAKSPSGESRHGTCISNRRNNTHKFSARGTYLQNTWLEVYPPEPRKITGS